MEPETNDLPREVVPVTFEYVTFDGGAPRKVEEKRHLYYTMGAMTVIYDLFGVDREEMGERLEGVEDPEEAQRIREEALEETEVEMSVKDAMARILYAGLRPEARAKGEDLSPEDVEDMIEVSQIDYFRDKIETAFELFQNGQEEAGSDADGEDPADLVGKATTGGDQSPEQMQRSPR